MARMVYDVIELDRIIKAGMVALEMPTGDIELWIDNADGSKVKADDPELRVCCELTAEKPKAKRGRKPKVTATTEVVPANDGTPAIA